MCLDVRAMTVDNERTSDDKEAMRGSECDTGRVMRQNCKMEPRDNTLINVFMNRTIKPHVTKFKFVPTTFIALHKV